MTASLRALRALALLAGFYLMGVALLMVLAAADWVLLTRHLVTQSVYLVLGTVFTSVALMAPILRGMFAFLLAGRRSSGAGGCPVTPQEQPELWAEVLEAARRAGTQAPDEVILTEGVNAAVAERARLLGLLPGRRRMYLGVPLLTGLTVPRLRAVLAHEFGHYSNQDTRLAGVTMRGRAAVLHTVNAFGSGDNRAYAFVGGLYVRYAHLFLKVTQSIARRQELAADQAAACQAGRDPTAAALRQIPLLDAAHDHYVDTYALMGRAASALPPVGEFHGGFRQLLAARQPDALSELAAARRPPRPSPYDSHPPVSERLALIEALPDDGLTDDLAAPSALSLLRDQDGLLATLEERILPAEASALQRLDWPDLVMVRALSDARGWAEPLQMAVRRALRIAHASVTTAGGAPPGPLSEGAAGVVVAESATSSAAAADSGTATETGARLPSLEDVLDAIDGGLLWMEVADRMPKPAQAARLTGRSARNFIRPAVWDAVAGLVHLHLIAEGLARPDVSWAGRPGLALPEDWEERMDAAIDAAVDDAPDTTPLRALLGGDNRIRPE
ncbi:M48 family metalloprotease [Streptomyces avermitilis]|uniref:M48 family metalloprotease n=1 Tax=Streptomyces avermitilis TaxID=33903 RepID=UPI0033BABBC7